MDKRTLSMDVKEGETLYIDGVRLSIQLVHKSGRQAKLRFVHGGDVVISRSSEPQAQAAVTVKQNV